jgi:predicted RNA binding protein YcfA (HicA-like mRNA interferase family)
MRGGESKEMAGGGRGSHEIWAHPDRDQRLVVAGKDSDTVPVGTLGSIRRASGLKHLR